MTTQSQAKRIFLELRKGGRSLRKVQAALREQGDGDVPTLRVLGDWSGKGGWVKAAEEWDAKSQGSEPVPKHPLTARERRFVEEYLVDLNGTQAAIRAGYSAKTAKVQASRLLTKANVRAAITAAKQDRAERTQVTQDQVLAELKKLGFANMADYIEVQSDGTAAIDLSKLDRDQAAAITEVVVDEYTEGRGDDARQVKRIRFKLADKRGALVDMGKHLGMFTDRVEHTGKDGGPIEYRDMDQPDFTGLLTDLQHGTRGKPVVH